MTEASSPLPKDLITSAILCPVILLLLNLLVQFWPVLWLAAIIGFIPGIALAKHKASSWADYQRLTKQAKISSSMSTRVAIYFVLCLAGSLATSIITHFLGSWAMSSIWGFLFGIGEGFVLWLLWLYFRRDQARRIS
jgi:hypothetical protein